MESTINHSCVDCALRTDRLFCDLPPNVLQALDGIKTFAAFARGTILFREGLAARNVYVLCEGRARLSVCSESGKHLTLRIANTGEALGLSAALSGGAYEVTAEALDDLQVAVLKRKDLLRFLHEQREACLQVVNLLSQDLHVAYERVRSVGLGRTRRLRILPV
jgi:CRP/FNR family transcriptional regulator, cyclic AMP receptor protein